LPPTKDGSNKKTTLPFDLEHQDAPLQEHQVLTLLQVTGLDLTEEVIAQVQLACSAEEDEAPLTPLHETVPPCQLDDEGEIIV
jgi:hypothetical protein